MSWEERAERVGKELKRVTDAQSFVAKRLDPDHEWFDPEHREHWEERRASLAAERPALEAEWSSLLADAEAELA